MGFTKAIIQNQSRVRSQKTKEYKIKRGSEDLQAKQLAGLQFALRGGLKGGEGGICSPQPQIRRL